jgi:putative FmdB family regulatory protein
VIYTYSCPGCGATKEVSRSIHAKEELPECHGPMSRVWDAAPVMFKGGGFYKTGG